MRTALAFALLTLGACCCPRPSTCDPPKPPDGCALPPCGEDQATWDRWISACVPAGECRTITCPGTDKQVGTC